MTSVVIVGGGLTGLVVGERLSAAGVEAVVLERESEPGGACRSVSRDGFVFDYTGHLLHVARPETRGYLEDLGVWSALKVHERRAAVVVGDHATPYPIQINTHALAPEVRRDCLLGFVRAWAAPEGEAPTSFRDWVLERFGEGLARHFFFPYNRKLYRAEPQELSVDWVGRYVPKPALEDVVDGAFGLHRSMVGYNATYRYPSEGGIRLLPDAVATRVGELRLASEVVSIDLGRKSVEVADGASFCFDHLVATLPLPRLVDMVRDPLPDEIVAARQALRWVRVVNLALGVAGRPPRTEHWLYFPDEDLPFYRVGFPSNHGRLAPDGAHTISVEISLDAEHGDVDREVAEADRALERIGLVDPDRVVVRSVTVLDPAYVVFDHPRRSAVEALQRFFAERGVFLAGRWAEWKYSAMEDAILDGMSVARAIACGDPPR